MISPYCAITAGHNLRLPQATAVDYKIKDNKPVSVSFSLARNEFLEPFSGEVEGFTMHPKWFKEESPYFDYGIIKLNNSLGNKSGYASLKSLPAAELLELTLNITGYPVDKAKKAPRMYTMSGSLEQVSDHKLFYSIDTSGGQSGSGVWFSEEEKVFCCGVHTTGYSGTKRLNSGVRITEDVIGQVEEWVG